MPTHRQTFAPARPGPLVTGLCLFLLLAGVGTPVPLSAQAAPAGGDPRAGWEGGAFFLESEDGRFRMTLAGRVQPRYQFRDPAGDESTSSFSLRRVRLDIRGHVLDERLTFQIMPDLARTASLRDGWVNWTVRPGLQVRAGQHVVPFHWHRSVSSNRQHFAERSRPSETFGFPNGYDVGVTVHGRDEKNRLAYGVGLFDGAGRNVAESNSSGNMASGRVTWAARGVLPREEPDQAHSETLHLSLGLGLQGATRSEVRSWDLGRSPTGNERADWATGTLDASLRWRGLSAYGEAYLRKVYPDDPALDAYTGRAHTLGAGYFLVPRRFEAVGRRSELRLDRRDADTREREWGVGLNVYHHGHLWKTHLQFLRREAVLGDDDLLLVQLHLQL